MSMLTVWYEQCRCSQTSVSSVWRPKQGHRSLHHPGSLEATHPGLGVSGKSELQRTMPYLSLSPFSTSRMTALMTLSPSMTLWVQMILRPLQSKLEGCECPQGSGNMFARSNWCWFKVKSSWMDPALPSYYSLAGFHAAMHAPERNFIYMKTSKLSNFCSCSTSNCDTNHILILP